jgi:hypothetical protein
VDLAALVRSRPPGPGGCRLVTVDGHSGSGKSVLAARLAAELTAPVLSMEELYPGWSGLAAAVPLARDWIAAPLFGGEPARWWRWDWVNDRREPEPRIQPCAPVVLLEGCGSGAEPLRPFTSTAIWVECSEEERRRRLRARADWPGYAPHHEHWRAQEEALYRTYPPPDVRAGCAHPPAGTPG